MTGRWKAAIRVGVLAVATMALGLLPIVAGSARAQNAYGWIALQIWECPSGMTADTFDPWSCWVSEQETAAEIWAGDGTPLYGTWDAYYDGWTWTWDWLAVGPPEAPIPYQIVQTVAPAGSYGWIVQYAMAQGDGSTVWLSEYAFGADLHIYNFMP